MSKPIETCYLCGSVEDLTDDHIPPEGFFLPGTANLIKVCSCRTCNKGFSNDDEAMRAWLSHTIFSSPAGRWILENKVHRSTFQRSPKLRANMAKFLRKEILQTQIGPVEMDVLDAPQARAVPWIIRLVKGFCRHYYPDQDYSNHNYRIRAFQPTDHTVVDRVKEVLPHLRYDYRDENVFRLWHGFAPDGPGAIWVMVFYDGPGFVIFQNSPEARAASS